MKNRILVTLAFLSMAGCLQKVTEVPGLDRVMTVDEFSAQRAVRERVLAFCGNDPGRYKTDPNCVNSMQSARTTTAGTGKFPRLNTALPESMRKK